MALQPGDVIFNEYASDDNANNNDFFELLVLTDNVDLRGLRVSDNELSNSNANATFNNGESVFVFGNNAYLNNVPKGTLVAVWSSATGVTTDTTVNPAANDFSMVLAPGTGVTTSVDGLGGSVNAGLATAGDALYLYLPGADGNSGGTDNIYLDFISYEGGGPEPNGFTSINLASLADNAYYTGNTASGNNTAGNWVRYDDAPNGSTTPGTVNPTQNLSGLRAGVTITQSGGSTNVTEGGATDTYTVILNNPPTQNVIINISPNPQSTTSPTSLTFTATNWNVAQTVTVTAVNDAIAEGNHSSTITHTATSTDTNYNGISISSVTANITDNDTAGINVTPTSGLVTTEAGGTATFTVALNSQPTSNVSISLTSSNTAEGTVSATPLTFTPANWNQAQTVTLTGVDDFVDDGNIAYNITGTSTSTDTNYQNRNFSVGATNNDNDTASVTITQSGGSTDVTEGGATDTYTVVLTSQPTANVTVAVNPGTQTTTNPTNLIFTTTSWNTPQTVTVSAVDDAVVEGNHTQNITHTATSSDSVYNNISIASVTANITDNDFNNITGSGRTDITGTANNDRIVGGIGGKSITSGAGNDIFVYTSLREVGHRIADFAVGSDDIDLSQLGSTLTGYTSANALSGGYVQFAQGSLGVNSTMILIDPDGAASTAGTARPFLQINNVAVGDMNNANNFIF